MAKMNVYVNDELKVRMDGYDLKWSPIASAAFEEAMNLQDRKEVSMEAASIERLRQSRNKAADKAEAGGVAAGKQWALEAAEYDQLEAVAAVDLSGVDSEAQPAYGWGAMIADAIFGEDAWGRDDIAGFCESWLGVRYPSFSSICGFIEGAAAVYAEV